MHWEVVWGGVQCFMGRFNFWHLYVSVRTLPWASQAEEFTSLGLSVSVVFDRFVIKTSLKGNYLITQCMHQPSISKSLLRLINVSYFNPEISTAIHILTYIFFLSWYLLYCAIFISTFEQLYISDGYSTMALKRQFLV